LDRARHRWAQELQEEDKAAAIVQLEKISPDYARQSKVHQALGNSYYQLLRDTSYAPTGQTNLDAEAAARYRLGMERWNKGDLEGAVEQLTKVHPETDEFGDARDALVGIYVALGQQAQQDKQLQDAVKWWDKALAIPQGLEWRTRRRIDVAKAQVWADEHRIQAAFLGVLLIILAISACFIVSQIAVSGSP